MLTVRSLTHTYEGAPAPAISDVSLDVGAGECLCLTGASGCGKTTLLLAVKGLLRGGVTTGTVAVAAQGAAGASRPPVGLVFQNAEAQNFCSTVAEEVAFGPENLCVPPAEIGERVRRALDEVGLAECWHRNVERLSAGQKHRLAIAAVLSTGPRVLLLDEPTAQLDAPGKAEVRAALARLKARGYALVIAEHDLAALEGIADRTAVMAGGRIVSLSARPPEAFTAPGRGARRGTEAAHAGAGGGAPALTAAGLVRARPGVGPVLRGIDLEVARGERLHVAGRNGAGKSTLLACLAGALAPDAGSVTIAGRRVDVRASLVGTLGYLLQNPARQLFEDSVAAEVAFSLKRLRLPAAEVERRVAEALEVCEVGPLARRLPLSLSFGEQHRVALASVLAPRPHLLLLDEPFSGLDLAQRRRMLRILTAHRERHDTTVLLASHDAVVDPAWPDRVLTLAGGKLA